jgi:hypothetical protein
MLSCKQQGGRMQSIPHAPDSATARTQEISTTPLLAPKAFKRTYATPGRPVIITNAMERWRARSVWSFEWFKQQHGDISVPVSFGKLDEDKAFTLQRIPFREYIDSITDSNSPQKGYLQSFDLRRLIPALEDDVAFPPYFWSKRLCRMNFWIGPGGTTSQLHCDYADNLLCQVVGSKRIQLYRADSQVLAQYHTNTTWYSSFNKYDFERNQRDATTPKIDPDFDFTLQAGQILFLPFGWWHRVTSLEPSISVNLWWFTPKMLISRSPAMAKDYMQRSVKQRKA